ncbi:hypothetical protein Anapl_09125 [Anas platyrhynchos]|uniref:Uncharacterized protein n=1 Tax=Anas platyrhynchos TaxID=8839 RepID=R0JPE9_ANAPL|nr:hypothetical protein Anapl_09125 [Anas platyrhynchos]
MQKTCVKLNTAVQHCSSLLLFNQHRWRAAKNFHQAPELVLLSCAWPWLTPREQGEDGVGVEQYHFADRRAELLPNSLSSEQGKKSCLQVQGSGEAVGRAFVCWEKLLRFIPPAAIHFSKEIRPRFSSACPIFLLLSSPRARQGLFQARRLQPAPQKLQRFTPEHLVLLSDGKRKKKKKHGTDGPESRRVLRADAEKDALFHNVVSLCTHLEHLSLHAPGAPREEILSQRGVSLLSLHTPGAPREESSCRKSAQRTQCLLLAVHAHTVSGVDHVSQCPQQLPQQHECTLACHVIMMPSVGTDVVAPDRCWGTGCEASGKGSCLQQMPAAPVKSSGLEHASLLMSEGHQEERCLCPI